MSENQTQEINKRKKSWARKTLDYLVNTPIHPQWLLLRKTHSGLQQVAANCRGSVLDIGCGRKTILDHLSEGIDYIACDYYSTSTNWYHSPPDLYADAHQLPLKSDSIDCVLLLDVIEHLEDPQQALRQSFDALKQNGKVIISIPFAYPIHDAPRDFQRLTCFGLQHQLNNAGFTETLIQETSDDFESTGLLLNILLAKQGEAALRKNTLFGLLLSPLLLTCMLVINIAFVSASKLIKNKQQLMPSGYFVTASKS